jgi:hypothetical protein
MLSIDRETTPFEQASMAIFVLMRRAGLNEVTFTREEYTALLSEIASIGVVVEIVVPRTDVMKIMLHTTMQL